jgi:hypothetical protein
MDASRREGTKTGTVAVPEALIPEGIETAPPISMLDDQKPLSRSGCLYSAVFFSWVAFV